MAKMKELDAKDRQIIHLLAQNARRPLTSLAKAINLSRSATQERLQRLEDKQVILGYTLRMGLTDRKNIEFWLVVRLKPGVTCLQVVPIIKSFTGASEVYALAGDIDLLVHGSADSADLVSDTRDEIAALSTVADVRTYSVLAAY
ncbi:MAG: Lrp/AsnC family transcriptional regulator [Burkholderiales bacterium]|nr:Lrp/AsnC family transcriptional regulator [Burkholderiales bacterium]